MFFFVFFFYIPKSTLFSDLVLSTFFYIPESSLFLPPSLLVLEGAAPSVSEESSGLLPLLSRGLAEPWVDTREMLESVDTRDVTEVWGKQSAKYKAEVSKVDFILTYLSTALVVSGHFLRESHRFPGAGFKPITIEVRVI